MLRYKRVWVIHSPTCVFTLQVFPRCCTILRITVEGDPADTLNHLPENPLHHRRKKIEEGIQSVRGRWREITDQKEEGRGKRSVNSADLHYKGFLAPEQAGRLEPRSVSVFVFVHDKGSLSAFKPCRMVGLSSTAAEGKFFTKAFLVTQQEAAANAAFKGNNKKRCSCQRWKRCLSLCRRCRTFHALIIVLAL